MTSRERLLMAIRHEEPDFVPVGPRVWVWLLEHYGSFAWPYEVRAGREFDFDPMIYLPGPYPNYVHKLNASYEELRNVEVELTIERFDTYTRLRRTIHTPAGTLSDRLIQPRPHAGYGADPNPHCEERLVKEPADLTSLAFLLPEPHPADYLDCVAAQAEIGERGLAHVYINSAIDHGGGWVMELEDLMIASIQQPKFIAAILALFHQHSLTQVRCALEAGISAVFVPWYFIISVIKDGTPELIGEQIHQAILAAAPGGFILGTSDSIREAPPANVRAYFAAARRCGDYRCLGQSLTV